MIKMDDVIKSVVYGEGGRDYATKKPIFTEPLRMRMNTLILDSIGHVLEGVDIFVYHVKETVEL